MEQNGADHVFSDSWLAGVNAILRAGPAGVALFFVLSGFILTYTYGDAATSPRIDRRRFAVARFARIYPVYALGLVIGLLPWLESVPWHRLPPIPTAINVGGVGGATVLLLQSWIPRMAHRWNSVGWSLSNEAFFYLCFPFLLSWTSRLRTRTLVLGAAAIYVGTMIASTIGWNGSPFVEALVYYHPLVRIGDFFMGIVAGQVYLRARASGERGSSPRRTITTALLLVVALAWSGALPKVLVQNSLFAPAFALVIYQLAWQRGRVAAFLSRPAMVSLGNASYAIYILHLLLFGFAFALLGRVGVAVTVWSTLGVGMGVIAICLALYRWYEEPARKWIRRRSAGVAASEQTALENAGSASPIAGIA